MDSNTCENYYKHSSSDKRCVFVDNRCIEQLRLLPFIKAKIK